MLNQIILKKERFSFFSLFLSQIQCFSQQPKLLSKLSRLFFNTPQSQYSKGLQGLTAFRKKPLAVKNCQELSKTVKPTVKKLSRL